MFFLGIAGSFMPYLICMAILFFLTIGTSSDVNVDLVELEEKKVEDFSVNSFTTSIDEDCYIFYQTKQKESIRKIDVFPRHNEYFEYKTQVKFPHLYILKVGYQYDKTHSGLSPPALIS